MRELLAAGRGFAGPGIRLRVEVHGKPRKELLFGDVVPEARERRRGGGVGGGEGVEGVG